VKLEKQKVVVCGGGFIGGHLVRALLANSANVVRAVDLKPREQWYQESAGVENLVLDLREKELCQNAVRGMDVVFNLAADMGGMGFIENNKALCMLTVLINTHLLLAARDNGVERFFYSSSACV
jgi:GDP-D-mannose 3',5'-epimerase